MEKETKQAVLIIVAPLLAGMVMLGIELVMVWVAS